MLPYIARRLALSLLTVFLALSLMFGVLHLSGDPVLLLVPADSTPEYIERVRVQWGFNDPLWVQYGRFISRAALGDFGVSLRYNIPALQLVLERLPATGLLTLVSIVFAVVVGVPLGFLAAIRNGSLADRLSNVGSVLGQSVPSFWLGLLLILLFSVNLGLLPTGGMGTPEQLILPGLTLGLYSLGRIVKLTRSSVLEVLRAEYVRTARAKGLSERVVLYRHVLKNAGIPIVTIIGLQMSGLLGGAIVVETIFAWPGLGRLIVQSIQFRDFPTALAAVFFTAASVSLVNLIVDLLYGLLNPRIVYE
ncbi:MAG: ABC transporter permease [Chloroflexi bacterium]|nr:ABC transporter permease [Chloroflexota bacterium]